MKNFNLSLYFLLRIFYLNYQFDPINMFMSSVKIKLDYVIQG